MKKLLILSFALAGSIYLYGQKFPIGDVPLGWGDFTIKEDFAKHPFSAKIYVQIPIRYEFKTKENITQLIINTEVVINSEKSWVKKQFFEHATKEQKLELLNHEKGHFMLSLIYHKKLQQLLLKHKFRKQQIKLQIDSIYKTISMEIESQNEIYDEETNHMLIVDKQQEWTAKLLNQLNDLYTEDKKLPLKSQIKIDF